MATMLASLPILLLLSGLAPEPPVTHLPDFAPLGPGGVGQGQELPGVTVLSQASGLDVAAGLAGLEPAPFDAYPVQAMGLGTLRVTGRGHGERELELAFTVEDGPGPAKGYLSIKDRRSAFTYSGTAQEVEVLEWTPGGAPRGLRITGTAMGLDAASFLLTVTAADQGRAGALVALSVGGQQPLDVPPVPLSSGYLTINGAQQSGRGEGWGGWHGSGMEAWPEGATF
jgi:hypothetical protein